jgi:hypothetical protein
MILNIDALLAVLIASLFITSMTLSERAEPIDASLERTANDLSAVLDKSGHLESLNSTSISEKMGQTLPANTDAGMLIACFTYNGSAFVSDQNITVQAVKGTAKTTPKITSARFFPVLGVTSVSKYCHATLEAWYV